MKTATAKIKKKVLKKTRGIILLDRSSSMNACAGIAVEGYNEHVDEFQEQAQDPETDLDVCLVTFSGQVYEHFWAENPEKIQKSSLESFCPSGSTALLDGIGYVIDTAYWLIIITDGGENSSKHYNISSITELLDGCDKADRWTISFLGASKEDIIGNMNQWGKGVTLSNCAAWSNTATGAKRMSAQNRRAAKSYFDSRKKGRTKVENLYTCDDSPEDADEQDKSLGIESQVAALKRIGGGPVGSNWIGGGPVGSSYTPENVGSADVFGTSGKCVVDPSYSRPNKS
jgi:hypothetical protein